MKLKGKVAIITGGSKGIGLGCARVFAQYDATVVMAARGQTDGQAAADELARAGHKASFVSADVRIEADIRRLVVKTAETFGRLDCLVNNAGWHPPETLADDIAVEDFESLLRLNLTSTFMSCKFAIPHLRKNGGTIINMSSAVAQSGQAKAASYVASKAGQIGLTRALAIDLAPDGIRVNAVCPGAVQTPLMDQWASSRPDPQAVYDEVRKQIPLGRMATIEEIGEVCAFLASDDAAFITGQTIYADGGALLG